jgi:hypothetical protein
MKRYQQLDGSLSLRLTTKTLPRREKAVFRPLTDSTAVLIASAPSLTVYFYTSNLETISLKNISNNVDKVFDSMSKRTLGIADSFVLGLVSYATHTNQTWPFVTLPDFGKRMAKTNSQGSGNHISHATSSNARSGITRFCTMTGCRKANLQANDTRYHGKIV